MAGTRNMPPRTRNIQPKWDIPSKTHLFYMACNGSWMSDWFNIPLISSLKLAMSVFYVFVVPISKFASHILIMFVGCGDSMMFNVVDCVCICRYVELPQGCVCGQKSPQGQRTSRICTTDLETIKMLSKHIKAAMRVMKSASFLIIVAFRFLQWEQFRKW